jgi:beta-glucosidase
MMKSIKLAVPLCLGLAAAIASLARAQETPKYLDPHVPVEQRIDDLLNRMTVEEKIGQISNDQGSAGIPRLQVPALWKTEAIHGQAFSTGATIFPQAIAMASTFDPGLIERVARETGAESRAARARSAWAPVLNVARDVRWGRVEETYGESPYLVSRMGVAWIDGFQSEGLIAVAKHFAVHGAPLGGRDSNDVGYSDRVMREIFLPGFRAAIEEAHAGGIMPAYSAWQGVPDNASSVLLQKILRQEWGFDGIVVSDCGALANFYTKQGIAGSLAESAALGIKAGVNLNCGRTYRDWAQSALSQGLISESQLDDAVRPMLRAKFRLGLFEHPVSGRLLTDKLPEYDSPAARTLAREVAVEGTVLLKNENNLLPLKKNVRTIAVIGPDADSGQTGDYSPKIAPGQVVSVLQGIRSHVEPNTQVLFAAGLDKPASTDTSKFSEAIRAAKQADVAVVVVGDNSRPRGGKATTGEGADSATLALPGSQLALVQAIQATGTPVVLILVNGKPITMAWEADHIPAILETWFPGEEGGNATADLLFGDRNPSGRLPLTWPRSVGQLPLNYDYLPTGRKYDYADASFTPQWPFGFGSSYTRFRYSNLHIVVKDGDPGFVTVSADVQNIGDRDGDEVSQLYVTDLVASVMTPVVELKGIERVSLKAGEIKTVTFQITPYDLSLLDENMVRRVEPGVFRIHVGGVVPGVPGDVVDQRKRKIGFTDPLQGISGEFAESKPYSARFIYTLNAPQRAKIGRSVPVTVTVRNDGNLTDVTETKLYEDSLLDSWSFELKPGETKSHLFHVTISRSGTLVLVAGSQTLTRKVIVN